MPNLLHGWLLRTPFGPVSVYDYYADRDEYRHDEHPDDVLRYSVGGYRDHAVEAFACVVAALVRAGQRVEIVA